eukprot:TRINITY_DN5944_c0_g1_i2.p2 TRINITY_DN5944_c0_g1~~TRINITY_DN5944_c0_g1_i2.p2  ORF type:complete len:110 (+),score=13.04 TRINITY_DN5944_c0_g1_i2:677-1006(+)
MQDQFYLNCKLKLEKGGILVRNIDSPMMSLNSIRRGKKIFEKLFSKVKIFNAYIPSYVSGEYSFVLLADTINENINWEKWQLMEMELQYYNKDIHYSSFIHPKYVQKAL